ncbi:MAG: transposase, partial [Candidatus Asgardarchaeia archaeon]
TGYGYRWIVESVISAVKRMFGETVRAHKWDQMVKEVIFHFIFYNVVISI